MPTPINNDAAQVRAVLANQTLRRGDDVAGHYDALEALDRLAATAEKAEALEKERDYFDSRLGDFAAVAATDRERAYAAEAALLAAQQDLRAKDEDWIAMLSRAERAEATNTRLREALEMLEGDPEYEQWTTTGQRERVNAALSERDATSPSGVGSDGNAGPSRSESLAPDTEQENA